MHVRHDERRLVRLLSGPHSNVRWQTPGASYRYMTHQMPVGNAGGLSRTDCLNIAAFAFQSSCRRSSSARRLTVSAITNDTAALDPIAVTAQSIDVLRTREAPATMSQSAPPQPARHLEA
jgi:hypothetical protein